MGVPKGTYSLAKVPTPTARSGWGRGYPKVPTPLAKVPTPPPPPARSGWGEGVPQGTYPPAKVLPSSQVRRGERVPQGIYPRPRYLPPPPTKDLLHGGQYACCVHAVGLSCFEDSLKPNVCLSIISLSMFKCLPTYLRFRIFLCSFGTFRWQISLKHKKGRQQTLFDRNFGWEWKMSWVWTVSRTGSKKQLYVSWITSGEICRRVTTMKQLGLLHQASKIA